jgi:dihydropteroate synthase
MNDNYTYQIGKKIYDLSSRVHVMGILNVTPDSFSDGGQFLEPQKALERARQIEAEGADFIDVGGQSTRPGSEEISAEEEMKRVIPVIQLISKEIKIPISIDTYHSQTAEAALENGAMIVNDISGFNFDDNMTSVIAKYKATAIAMHIRGRPKDMQLNPVYEDLLGEVISYFEKIVWRANVAGIKQIIIDPGIGFGKTTEHNLLLIKHIGELKRLDTPLMIGVSRKSFIGRILDSENPLDRLEGTITLNTIAALNGANIIRVHDVKAGVRTARIIDAYRLTE